MPLLSNLNLSDNCIKVIENLDKNTRLSTLQLKRNNIGLNGIDDLKGLLDCPSISSLDLSENKIDDERVVEEILAKMPNLGVLYFSGNEVCKKIKNYRKTIIN